MGAQIRQTQNCKRRKIKENFPHPGCEVPDKPNGKARASDAEILWLPRSRITVVLNEIQLTQTTPTAVSPTDSTKDEPCYVSGALAQDTTTDVVQLRSFRRFRRPMRSVCRTVSLSTRTTMTDVHL